MKLISLRRIAAAFVIGLFANRASAAELTLHSFTGAADGANPSAALVPGGDGYLYGVTRNGGTTGGGTAFKVSPGGALTTLHAFTTSEGRFPCARLAKGRDGNFYSVTREGGAHGFGTIYRMTPAGAVTVLFSFDFGQAPVQDQGALVLGNDGNFYGVTTSDGPAGEGSFYRITPSGVRTILHSFDASIDQMTPSATALLQGADGNFYAASGNGLFDASRNISYSGSIYKLTPAGALTVLYQFPDGEAYPYNRNGLALGNDGNFYGVSWYGGANDAGIFFRITPGGAFNRLHDFSPNLDGFGIGDDVIAAGDGSFLATSSVGVFRLTSAGTVSASYVFPDGGSNLFGSALVQGGDGNFYGTTASGGAYGAGGVYQLTAANPVAVTPRIAFPLVLESHCVTVSAQSAGRPVVGAKIGLTRTGANPGAASLVTGADGTARHCWAAQKAGRDLVQVSYGGYNDYAAFTWARRPTTLVSQGIVAVNTLLQFGQIYLQPSMRLTDTTTGAPIQGQTVYFQRMVGREFTNLCQATTDANGVAQCLFLPRIWSVGIDYSYQGVYAGDWYTYESSYAKGNQLCVGTLCF